MLALHSRRDGCSATPDASLPRDEVVQEVPEEVAEEMETEEPAAVSYCEPLTIHSDLEKEEG